MFEKRMILGLCFLMGQSAYAAAEPDFPTADETDFATVIGMRGGQQQNEAQLSERDLLECLDALQTRITCCCSFFYRMCCASENDNYIAVTQQNVVVQQPVFFAPIGLPLNHMPYFSSDSFLGSSGRYSEVNNTTE